MISKLSKGIQDERIREWVISAEPGAVKRAEAFRPSTRPKAISQRKMIPLSRLTHMVDGYNDIKPLILLWAKGLTPRQRIYVENYIYKGKKNLQGCNSRELKHLRQNWEAWFLKYRLLTYTYNR